MGFFSKAKKFLGGHGCTVELTRIERQDPASASMPLTDTVIKGNMVIKAEQDCNVLEHRFEFSAVYEDDDGVEQTHTLGSDAHDSDTDIIGGDLNWPYDLAAGSEAKDSFLIHMEKDVPTQLRKLGFSDPEEAVRSGKVTFRLRVIADVKGSPFDPKSDAMVTLTC